MNIEDRLKGLMDRAGEPDEPTELEWMAFARTARRSLLVHRVVAVAAAAAVLVTGALGGYALVRSDAFEREHPPVDVVPHPLPRRVPAECPNARSYQPSSELGSAAFVRDGDLYRVDVDTGTEYKLVDGRNVIYSPQVSWSPDGTWIHLGEGVIVPAAGGPVCQPFGQISDAQWVGERLVGIRRGGVVTGVPSQTAQAVAAIHFDGDVNSFAMTRAAGAWPRASTKTTSGRELTSRRYGRSISPPASGSVSTASLRRSFP